MEWTVHELHGQRCLEGTAGAALMLRPADVRLLIEACMGEGAHAALLYPEQLTAGFFDLSSGDAGAILQALRTYNIRFAVLRTPGLRLSSRFGELLADEQRGPYFRLMDERAAALEWLCSA